MEAYRKYKNSLTLGCTPKQGRIQDGHLEGAKYYVSEARTPLYGRGSAYLLSILIQNGPK